MNRTKDVTNDSGLNTVQKDSVICPDNKSECSQGSTCCKVPDGWECCGYMSAVCCSDQKHCCPNGYTCDLGSGTCTKGD